MAYGLDAIKKWQTSEELISIKNENGGFDEIPIKRIPNTEFPKFFRLGLKLQDSPEKITEQDVKDLVRLISVSIKQANEGSTVEECENLVLTKFGAVMEAFQDINGGSIEVSDIPENVKEQLGLE